MDIQQMIQGFQEKMEVYEKELSEQTDVVQKLGQEYEKQYKTLVAIRQCVLISKQTIEKLQKLGGLEPKNEEPESDRETDVYDRLYKLLNDAVTIAVDQGAMSETVPAKNGSSHGISMRESYVSRAMNAILRSGKENDIASLSDEDILDMRNIGRKTAKIIRIARNLAAEEQNIFSATTRGDM